METKKLGSWAYLQHTQEAGLGYHVTLFFFAFNILFFGVVQFFLSETNYDDCTFSCKLKL